MAGLIPAIHVFCLARKTWMRGTSPRMTLRGALSYHADAAAGRSTGFSMIGRLITAESTPNSTESHHTGL